MGPIHWDDAPSERIDRGALRRTRWDLGAAAGSVNVGVKRVVIDPGGQSSPVHAHSNEEEIFYVLGGSGRLWQDGAVHDLGPDDAIVHVSGGPAHTLVGGTDGLEVLAFGERNDAEGAFLPRVGVAWHGDTWVEAGGGEHPFEREAALGPVDAGGEPAPRPANIVACDDVPPQEVRHGATEVVRRDLGRAAGSVTTGLVRVAIAPGAESHPPHCHSAEEELFVVLEGTGVLRLGDHEHVVGVGSVVARPAGTGVAHSWVAGDDGLVVLAYGQRDSRDVIWYPRSQKVSIKGIRVMFRVEPVGYWDGEE